MTDTTATHPTVIHFRRLLGSPVVARTGDRVGRLADLIVRLRGDAYPVVTGVVVDVAGRRIFVAWDDVDELAQEQVRRSQNTVDVRGFERRAGEVLLDDDLLDHRLIDVSAAELVHAFDIELVPGGVDDPGTWVLARLDTRRPARMFGLVRRGTGHARRDWKSFEPLIGHGGSVATRSADDRMRQLRPAELANLIEDANRTESCEILDRVHGDPELEADVFEELDSETAARLLDARSDADVAALLSRMRADDAADTIADLKQSRRRRVLDAMPDGARAKVITLLGFNPDSAGGLMNVDILARPVSDTARDALHAIAAAGSLQPEALLKVQVLDDAGRLTGVVSVIRLLQSDPGAPLRALMDDDPVRVETTADVADIALLMSDYNLATIPVVDDDDRVLGVVTVDDVLEVTIPDDWRRREPAPRPVRGVGPGTNGDLR